MGFNIGQLVCKTADDAQNYCKLIKTVVNNTSAATKTESFPSVANTWYYIRITSINGNNDFSNSPSITVKGRTSSVAAGKNYLDCITVASSSSTSCTLTNAGKYKMEVYEIYDLMAPGHLLENEGSLIKLGVKGIDNMSMVCVDGEGFHLDASNTFSILDNYIIKHIGFAPVPTQSGQAKFYCNYYYQTEEE